MSTRVNNGVVESSRKGKMPSYSDSMRYSDTMNAFVAELSEFQWIRDGSVFYGVFLRDKSVCMRVCEHVSYLQSGSSPYKLERDVAYEVEMLAVVNDQVESYHKHVLRSFPELVRYARSEVLDLINRIHGSSMAAMFIPEDSFDNRWSKLR